MTNTVLVGEVEATLFNTADFCNMKLAIVCEKNECARVDIFAACVSSQCNLECKAARCMHSVVGNLASLLGK